MNSGSDSIDMLRKDHTQLASSLSVLTKEVAALQTQMAVREERDKRFEENQERTEKSLADLWSIGKWALLAFFGGLIAAFVTFLVKGGLNVPPPTP
jgi:hypothetical protein